MAREHRLCLFSGSPRVGVVAEQSVPWLGLFWLREHGDTAFVRLTATDLQRKRSVTAMTDLPRLVLVRAAVGEESEPSWSMLLPKRNSGSRNPKPPFILSSYSKRLATTVVLLVGRDRDPYFCLPLAVARRPAADGRHLDSKRKDKTMESRTSSSNI